MGGSGAHAVILPQSVFKLLSQHTYNNVKILTQPLNPLTIMSTQTNINSSNMPCLMQAWHTNEHELRRWLLKQSLTREQTEDFLQEMFIKSMKQGQKFCAIENPRAWFFIMAKRMLIDQFRTQKNWVELDEYMPEPLTDKAMPVDSLTVCLPRVLNELSEQNRQAIQLCDIDGMTQAEFAHLTGLSLSGAKSRLQRARLALAAQLKTACQVKFDESGAVCCFTPRN